MNSGGDKLYVGLALGGSTHGTRTVLFGIDPTLGTLTSSVYESSQNCSRIYDMRWNGEKIYMINICPSNTYVFSIFDTTTETSTAVYEYTSGQLYNFVRETGDR